VTEVTSFRLEGTGPNAANFGIALHLGISSHELTELRLLDGFSEAPKSEDPNPQNWNHGFSISYPKGFHTIAIESIGKPWSPRDLHYPNSLKKVSV